MTPAPTTSDVIRRIMRHPDVRDVDVADTEDLAVATVRAVRLERRRNAQDGTRYKPPRPGAPARTRRGRGDRVDIDSLMRTNQSVCP